MNKNIIKITAVLAEMYPVATCALNYHGEAWRLLVMSRLSAQCTDARVNIVSEVLFEKYPTLQSLASAPLDDIENIVRPCGLFHVKAKNIRDSCRLLAEKYHGVLPDTIEELLTFPGVGRKIANLLLGDIYGIPGIVTDTHCIRICGRIGIYGETMKNPYKAERIIAKSIPPDLQTDFCHRLVLFGREVCTARAPKCDICKIGKYCPACGNGIAARGPQ